MITRSQYLRGINAFGCNCGKALAIEKMGGRKGEASGFGRQDLGRQGLGRHVSRRQGLGRHDSGCDHSGRQDLGRPGVRRGGGER